MGKKQLTAEEIYKNNQQKSKTLKILSPICFWGFWALGILCLIFAIKNSFGNIAEITSLLDSQQYTGEQLQSNYAYLIDKYGEWVIGTGSGGFMISFINIGKALFSTMMILNLIFGILFIVCAYVLGKWLFPHLSQQILTNNQDMVNLTILKDKQ